MPIWRIRVTLPGEPGSQALLTEALANQPVRQVRLTPRAAGAAELTGDVVLELGSDEGLGALLSALHTISPQVFVARAEPLVSATHQPGTPAHQPVTGAPRQALRVRRLSSLRARAVRPLA